MLIYDMKCRSHCGLEILFETIFDMLDIYRDTRHDTF
jgi:hypothetical protein